MQKIVPNIWCNGTAEAAAHFYADVFPNTTGQVTSRYPDKGLLDFQQDLAGAPLTAEVVIDGYQVVLINAGPEFPPTPAISLMLTFDPARDPAAAATLEAVWAGLLDGGEVLMELGEYPFSRRYGWIRDRFGATWQLILADPDAPPRPFVMPALLFCGPAQGRARAAIDRYTGLFPESEVGVLVDDPDSDDPAAPGEVAVLYADFTLAGLWLVAMDSGEPKDFTFTCGVSLQVNCADQAEIDHFWDTLSAVPEAEQCGWCADEFGVSWQIVPADMDARMAAPQAWTAMMSMKKLVLADLPLP